MASSPLSPSFPPIRSIITGNERLPRSESRQSSVLTPQLTADTGDGGDKTRLQLQLDKMPASDEKAKERQSPTPSSVAGALPLFSPERQTTPVKWPPIPAKLTSGGRRPTTISAQLRATEALVSAGQRSSEGGQGDVEKGQISVKAVRNVNSLRRNQISLLKCLHLSEDNARFLLLAFLLVFYAIIGATMFMLIEAETEVAELERQLERLRRFRLKYPRVSRADLNELLEVKLFLHDNGYFTKCRPEGSNSPQQLFGGSSSEETWVINNGPDRSAEELLATTTLPNLQWTFSGALYFTYTLMTTTGFGMITPRTKLGRTLTVLFGFIGCTSTILFFNLFLERVITLLTLVITKLHRWAESRSEKRRRQSRTPTSLSTLGLIGLMVSNPDQMTQKMQDGTGSKAAWKPSLYAVFCVLFFMSISAVFICSTTFAIMEDTWTFLDSVYASFVAFATIGFGDLVPAFGDMGSATLTSAGYLSLGRRTITNHSTTSPFTTTSPPEWYRLIAILSLGFGTCCYYSLFNVSSILVKRFLTLVINKLNVDVAPLYEKCCRRHKSRLYKSHNARPVIDPENGKSVNESELRHRQTVIAHMRAAAVDRAMAKYDSSNRASYVAGMHRDKSSVLSGLGDHGKAENKTMKNNPDVAETTFLPSTNQPHPSAMFPTLPKSGSSNNNLAAGQNRGRTTSNVSSGSGTARGRPKPQTIHPTVLDSDEDEEGSNGDDYDDDDMVAGRKGSEFKSEALKKVGMMKNNAIVLALMQKQLHAQQSRLQQAADEEASFGQPVGPLAIAKNMLE